MPIGDFLRPIFSPYGEFKGVEFDCDLAPLMFKENGSKLLIIQRTIKVCAFINILLQEGLSTDFVLTKVQNPE